MQNQKKFEDVIQIYLTSILLDFLGIDKKNLLYCTKNITNTIVEYYIKNKQIGLSIAKKMITSKQKNIRYIFVDIFLNISKEDFNFTAYQLIHLSFDSDFNEPLKIGVLPPTLTYLLFGNNFNHPLQIGVLPSTLSQLTFGRFFNKPLQIDILPCTLTYLSFGDNFNQRLEKDVLPSQLIYLKFGRFFNKPFKIDILPCTLTYLEFGKEFSQPLFELNKLSSLIHLKFGFWFNWHNRPMGPLPKTLKYLQIPIHNNLPLPDHIEIKYVKNSN